MAEELGEAEMLAEVSFAEDDTSWNLEDCTFEEFLKRWDLNLECKAFAVISREN